MAKILPDLKALVLAGGFRYEQVVVPEWESVTFMLREPTAGAWLRYRSALEATEENVSDNYEQQAKTIAAADAILFVSVLLDTDGNRVFTDEDIPIVAEHYGPVHARLLRRSLALLSETFTPSEDAEKKSLLLV